MNLGFSKRVKRWLAVAAAMATSVVITGCSNANVSYGVGYHSGSYGWGNSFSAGISNHRYRNYPRYRGP